MRHWWLERRRRSSTGASTRSSNARSPSRSLPAALAADAERLARFEREATTLAALNHPNIAALYGLEDGGATTALVRELVEGQTLADRVRAPRPRESGRLHERVYEGGDWRSQHAQKYRSPE
jgi:serine/threonine protein kinase